MELSDRQKRRRVFELRGIARILSCGEEEEAKNLISDAAGSFNRTTISIGEEMDEMRKKKENMSDENKKKIVSLLKHVKAAGSFGDAKNAGCFAGKKLWRSSDKSKKVVKNCNVIKKNKIKRSPRKTGRKTTVDVGKISESWVSRASLDGTVNVAPTRIAREIGTEVGCSWRHALRWRPEFINLKRNATALCGVCELLRKRRLLCMNIKCTSADGSRDVRALWENSSFRNKAPQDVRVLEKHEKALEYLKSQYIYDQYWACQSDKNRVCVFDYAASVTFQSHRGTGYEFNSKTSVTYFGGMVFDTRGVAYHHVFDFRKKVGGHTAHHGMSCVQKIFQSDSFLEGAKIRDLHVRTWSDTASCFRSKEFVGSLLDSVESSSMRVSFHCEEHGKTSLDAIFVKGKDAIRAVDADSCTDVNYFVEQINTYLQSLGGDTRHVVHHLSEDSVIPTVSLVLPGKTMMSTPYFWERKSRDTDCPLFYLDLSDASYPLLVSSMPDPKEVRNDEEDILANFRGQKPSTKTIVSRVDAKYKRSILLHKIAS